MLTLLSLFYLALPYFLFVLGWLWWPYAVLLATALLMVHYLARPATKEEPTRDAAPPKAI